MEFKLDETTQEIAHVRYIKILIWLRGFGSKLQLFHDSFVSQ